MTDQSFGVEQLRAAAINAAAAAEAAAAELNAQDGKMGDGDLGITVAGGYLEIAREAERFPVDLGQAFLLCAKAFQRVSASSYGTLTATAFLAAARYAKGRSDICWVELGPLLELARDAMMARGKGSLGDKSVLDLLDAVAHAIQELDEPGAIRAAAQRACVQTLGAFRDRACKLGRARAHGEVSIGLDDPGMLALWRLIQSL